MVNKVPRSTTTRTRSNPPHKTHSTITSPISRMTVNAHEQPHVSLGSFTADHPPKGFSIHLSPDPEPDSIITQVVKLGSEWRYELVLHIANYGDRAIEAEVWPID